MLLRRGEPVAALVSIDKYNDFLALEKLARHPELFDRLRAQARKAGTTPIESLGTLQELEATYKVQHKPKPARAASAAVVVGND